MKEFIGFRKGVDLGGWLSQCDYDPKHMESFITKSDLEQIKSWGLDHVRLPVDYNVLETAEGVFDGVGFKHIDNAVAWCGELGLNIVIDLHKAFGFSFDEGEQESGFFESEELQQRFYKLWETLAQRYGNCPIAAFELLNEVTEQKYCKKWNEIIKNCIERIRKYAPNTPVIVGGYWQNSPHAVKDLDPPYDENVVYNFHCYDPLKFTHQGGEWVKELDPMVRLSFDECDITVQMFIDAFSEAVNAAKANNTCLYCGEYGVIDRVTPEDTVKWFKTINAAFEHYGISRAAWNYKEKDFGISGERLSGVIDELKNYF